MSHLIGLIATWLLRKLGLLLLIVAVLLVGAWLKSEWDDLRAGQVQLVTQAQLLAELRAETASIDAALAADAATWRGRMAAIAGPLGIELDGVEARIATAQPRWQEALRQFGDIRRQADAAQLAAQRARTEFAILERSTYWWDKFVDPAKVLALERARLRLALLERAAQAWATARERVAPALERAPMRALLARQTELQRSLDDLRDSVSPRQPELRAARQRKAQQVTQTETLLAAQRERLAREPRQRLAAAVRAQLPLALAVLAAALLTPLLLKALFYFLLAPLAARQPAIRILADPTAPSLAPPRQSGVSVGIELAPGEELLVQSDFLQSSVEPARKRTQWLLNTRLPFASLASGMYALTRIDSLPGAATATRIVISAPRDPFAEVAVLELPAGAAMVLQPRALAGVVQPAGTAVRITRHWRLGSLHAWLTLQLRYLVFHGPCRLIVRGCRGVRAEAPDPGQPRLINQAATLGFSANLDYRTTRCETFVSYLLGRDALLNDRFAGAPGLFVYEQMPGGGRRSGVTGRGLEGLTDAVLKAFGI